MKKFFGIIVLIFVSWSSLQAQSGWSINPSDYQFSMTVTGSALIDCQNSITSTDEVAAFAGGVLRGAVEFNTLVDGENLAYLIVYSNVSQGDTLSFKIYDESNDVFIDLNNELIFEENGSVGSSGNSYVFSNNHPPTDMLLAES